MARSYSNSNANSVRSDIPSGSAPDGFKAMTPGMSARTGGRLYSAKAISADDAMAKHPEMNTLLNNDDTTDALALAISNAVRETAAEYADEYFAMSPSERKRAKEIGATINVKTEGGKVFEVEFFGPEVEFFGGSADDYQVTPPDYDEPEDIYRPDIMSYAKVREVRLGTNDEFTTASSEGGFSFGKVKHK